MSKLDVHFRLGYPATNNLYRTLYPKGYSTSRTPFNEDGVNLGERIYSFDSEEDREEFISLLEDLKPEGLYCWYKV